MQLHADNNKLETLPDPIGKLYLQDNHRSTFLGSGMRVLKVLSLANNRLSREDSFPQAMAKLPSLRYLYLRANRLTRFPLPVTDITSLTGLDLQHNHLTSIPDEIKNLTKLSELYLQYNNLSVIPNGIGKLTALEWLSLDNNRLSTLPQSILGLPLQSLRLTVHKNYFLSKEEEGMNVLFLVFRLTMCYVPGFWHDVPSLLDMCCLRVRKEMLDTSELPIELKERLVNETEPCHACGRPIFGNGAVIELRHMRLVLVFYVQEVMLKGVYCSLACSGSMRREL